METNENEKSALGSGVLHSGARPMQVYLDDEGCMWLCDKGIDPKKGFEQQGCWRCSELQFTRND